MNKIFTTLLALTFCLGMSAQKASTQIKDSLLFKHLAIGGTVGTTGIGVEVATSLNRHFAIRAGFQVLAFGTINMKLPINNGEVFDFLRVDDPAIDNAVRQRKTELGLNITMITGDVLVDYYPWKNKTFHITGGMYFGNRSILHFFNRKNGELRYLNQANEHVATYNELFHTKYPEVGLQFGDYVFTADKNGNLDAKMQEWAVRPYVGVGWGHAVSLSHKRKVNFNFDGGVKFWGSPKFRLNNEKTISSNDKDSGGLLQIISGFQVWPSLRFTVSGDIF